MFYLLSVGVLSLTNSQCVHYQTRRFLGAPQSFLWQWKIQFWGISYCILSSIINWMNWLWKQRLNYSYHDNLLWAVWCVLNVPHTYGVVAVFSPFNVQHGLLSDRFECSSVYTYVLYQQVIMCLALCFHTPHCFFL